MELEQITILLKEKGLNLPDPNIFKLIWTLLIFFLFLGIILYSFKVTKFKKAHVYFILNFLFIFSWPFIFLFSPKSSLILIVLMIILTMLLIYEFFKVSKILIIFLIPYLAWLLFALYLTYQIIRWIDQIIKPPVKPLV